ncbi:MAG: hypothetical protein ACKVGZ_21270 [Alphaproteobacteria bacterium]
MLKETVIAVTVVTVAAAGTIFLNPASAAGQQPIHSARLVAVAPATHVPPRAAIRAMRVTHVLPKAAAVAIRANPCAG